jgi:hypothetical protein
MKAERFDVKACCGKTSIIYKIDEPLSKKHLEALIRLGFKEHTHFTQAGILYADNLDLIVTGPFGSDKLQLKCKNAACNQKTNEFEVLLAQIG